jgi:hypothetical protein
MCGRAGGVNSVLFSPSSCGVGVLSGGDDVCTTSGRQKCLGGRGRGRIACMGGKNAPGQERQTFRTSELDTESDMVGCLVTPIQVYGQGLNVNKSEPSWC